jgi:hypothetical protein
MRGGVGHVGLSLNSSAYGVPMVRRIGRHWLTKRVPPGRSYVEIRAGPFHQASHLSETGRQVRDEIGHNRPCRGRQLHIRLAQPSSQ